MIKRLLIGLAVVLAVSASVVYAVPPLRIAVVGWLHREPFARGMPSHYWIEVLVNDADPEARGKAAAALVEIGPEMLPDLLRALRVKGAPIAPESVEVLCRLPAHAAPFLVADAMGETDCDKEFRPETVRVVLRMGIGAQSCADDLIGGLTHPDAAVRRDAARILARIGPSCRAAVPALSGALGDPDVRVRRQAAAALTAMGSEASKALPAIRKALLDRDSEVRRLAALTAGRIGRPARSTTPDLLKLTRDPESRVRTQAARALGLVGADGKDTVQALALLLKTKRGLGARKEAVVALGRLGARARPALPELIAAVFSEYLDLSAPALEALSRLGVTAAEVSPYWASSMKSGSADPRVASTQTRKLLDRKLLDPGQAKELLLKLAHDRDSQCRLRARTTLVHVAPTAPETAPSYRAIFLGHDAAAANKEVARLTGFAERAVPLLEVLLRDESPLVRQKAVSIAQQIAGRARALLPALVARQKDPDVNVQMAASMAQNNVIIRLNETLAVLAKRWRQSGDPGERYEALCKLLTQHSGQPAIRDLIPALLEAAAKDSDPNMRLLCVHALKQALGYNQQAIWPALGRAMKDKHPAVRAEALFAWRWCYDPSLQSSLPTIVALLKDEDWEVRHQAIFTLSNNNFQSFEGAEEGIPPLLAALKDPDASIRQQAGYLLGRYGPLASEAVPALVAMARKAPDGWDRATAIGALTGIGPTGRDIAVRAALAGLLEDRDQNVRSTAARAVVRLCPRANAVRALERALNDSAEQVRVSAAEALFLVEPRSRKGIPVLVKTVQAPNSPLKGMAAVTLGNMGPAAKDAAQALLGMLDDSNNFFRSQAIYALANIGVLDGKTADSVLSRLLQDADFTVRSAAASYLRRVGPEQRTLVPSLRGALTQVTTSLGSDPTRAQPILEALGNIGPDAMSAVPQVVHLLKHADVNVRSQAIAALSRIAPEAPETLSLVSPFLNDVNPGIRDQATTALRRIDPSGKVLVPRLVPLLKSPLPATRSQALAALGRLGALAKSALPDVRALLADKDLSVRLAAVEALWKVARSAEGVPVLVKVLQNRDAALRERAANVVVQLGPAARAAVPDLIVALTDPSISLKRAALSALGRIGPDAHEAVAAITDVFNDSDVFSRYYALESLGRIGPAAKEAVPKIRPLLRDPAQMLRDAAARALGGIGPDAKEAVAGLHGMLADVYLPARFAAAEALWQVAREDKEAVRVLVAGVKSLAQERYIAIRALGRIGQSAAAAAPVLEKALAEPGGSWLKVELAEALWRVTGKPDKTVALLTGMLGDPFSYTRSTAAAALGRMGSAAKNANIALRALAKDPDAAVSQAASDALEKINAVVANKEK